jgi:hypothetical protein
MDVDLKKIYSQNDGLSNFLSKLIKLEENMPAIASLDDLKAAQKDLLEAANLEELKSSFKKWRKIGWKNVCKLWLQERTPEQLKGDGM